MTLTTPSAEAAVIGSCLLDDRAMDWCYYNLPEEHFLALEHRKLYAVLLRLRRSGTRVDFVTVSDSMTDYEKKKAAATLVSITEGIKDPRNVRHYAKLLHTKYVTSSLEGLYDKAKSNPFDEGTQKEIRRLWDSLSQEQDTIIPIKDGAMRYSQTLDARKSGKITRLLTNYERLDLLTGGFLEGNLVSVGARSSVGKSAFLMNLADRFMKVDRKVLFVSAEMTLDELMDRLVAMRSEKFTVSRLRRGEIEKDEFRTIQEILADASEQKFWCIEGGRMTISRVRSALEVVNPDVLFVDFIQRFSPPNYNVPRAAYFSDVINELKNIAKEKRIVVIAASQLNREIERDENREPRLSDYKESGGIEEASDYSIMLRGEKDEAAITKKITVYVNKSRNGPCGKVDFDFIKPRTLFVERDLGGENDGERVGAYTEKYLRGMQRSAAVG